MEQKIPQPILVVEDSPEDYEAAIRAFKKSGLVNSVFRCVDGDDALDYMFRRGAYKDPASSPRPGLILLDLNLPGTDGREFLIEIKQDPDLKKIPVVVLTTSSDQADIDKCYEAGANSYICKPVNIVDLMNAIQRLKDFFFEIVVFSNESKMSEDIKLLIIDDSPEDRDVYKRLLSSVASVNYIFMECDCGEDGLDFLGSETPDCVLLDYNLPDMDGIEILETLAEHEDFNTPLIFLTGQGNETIAVRAMKYGATDYLVKTDINSELLNRSIKHAIDKKDSEQKLRHYVLELEKANKQILKQQKDLIEEERLKVTLQMAGATAHEMNQPLMVMLGNIDLLSMDQDLPHGMKKHIDRIRDAGNRISNIVKQIQNIRHYKTQSYAGGEKIMKFDQTINLLIVEENDNEFELLMRELADRTDFKVSRMKYISEASQVSSNVDLIILNYILPSGTGIDFLHDLEKHGKDIPAIILTGTGDEPPSSKSIQAGVCDYLPKSLLDKNLLVKAIHASLEKYRLYRAQQ